MNDNNKLNIGENIKKIRLNFKMNQGEFANILKTSQFDLVIDEVLGEAYVNDYEES